MRPTTEEARPRPQSEQEEAPANEKLPAGHRRQSESSERDVREL